jgi:hypothetical protein
VETFGDIDRILAGHGVGDQKRLDRAGAVPHGGNFVHQLLVDMQPAGGIQHDHVEPAQPGGLHGARGDIDRLLAGEHFFLFFFLKALADLGGRRGFTRPLQANHHDRHRRRRRQVQPDGITTQHFHQVIVDQLDNHLARRNRTQDFRARRLYGNVLDQFLDDRQGDVGLQQRDPQFAHRRRDVGLFQCAALAQPP